MRGLISLPGVDTTPDLRYCKVYVSALDKGDGKDMVKGLKSASGYLRRELAKRMTLRYTPELIFTPTTPSTRAAASSASWGTLKKRPLWGPALTRRLICPEEEEEV